MRAILLCLVLSACGSVPTVEYRDVVSQYAALKAEIPETLPYHIAALNVERCGDKICMSEDDFQQSEQDKDNLAAMKQALESENQSRARNNNSLVDALIHRSMEAERREEEAKHLERALRQERASNTLQMWVERILWLGGIYIMGNI